MKIVWFLFSLCLLVGCKHPSATMPEVEALPVIDLNASYPEKKIDLAKVAKSEYIPLYTVGTDSLGGYDLTSACVTPHWIVAYNRQHTIMVLKGSPESSGIVSIIKGSVRNNTILYFLFL